MHKGERGEAVALVQQALIDDGTEMPVSTGRAGGPDGIYGDETVTVVQQFQVRHGLLERGRADGLAGRRTLGKLDTVAVGGPATPPLSPTAPHRLWTPSDLVAFFGAAQTRACIGEAHGSFSGASTVDAWSARCLKAGALTLDECGAGTTELVFAFKVDAADAPHPDPTHGITVSVRISLEPLSGKGTAITVMDQTDPHPTYNGAGAFLDPHFSPPPRGGHVFELPIPAKGGKVKVMLRLVDDGGGSVTYTDQFTVVPFPCV